MLLFIVYGYEILKNYCMKNFKDRFCLYENVYDVKIKKKLLVKNFRIKL